MNSTLELREPEVQERVEQKEHPPRPVLVVSPRPLFADILLDVDGGQRRRRSSTAVLSFIFHCFFVSVLLLVPLWYTDTLPKQQLLTFLVAPPPPPPPPAPAAPAPQVVRRMESELIDGRLRTPSRIPEAIRMIREEEAPPPLTSGAGVVGGVPGGIPGGQLGGVIGGIVGSIPNTAAPKLVLPTAPKRIRISEGITKGQLIQKATPIYPRVAVQARIQGAVVLSARISTTGEIQDLEVVSGHPMLIPAALDAVKVWRYRPFLLNGQPVEVETRITVNFTLSQ
jgi:protein TonB